MKFHQLSQRKGQDKATIVELTNKVSTHCQERFVGLHEVFYKAKEEDGISYSTGDMKHDSQGNRELANAVSAIVEPYDYIISMTTAQWVLQALQMQEILMLKYSRWVLR